MNKIITRKLLVVVIIISCSFSISYARNNINYFPQPANKVLSVKVGPTKAKIKLTITTLDGKEMISKEFPNGSLESEIALETHTLTPGNYVLTIQKDETKETHKVVID